MSMMISIDEPSVEAHPGMAQSVAVLIATIESRASKDYHQRGKNLWPGG